MERLGQGPWDGLLKGQHQTPGLPRNFAPALAKMTSICADWTRRNITLKGKVVVLNSLIFPIIYYQCTMLYAPPRVIKEINQISNSFLWSGKSPKISKACLGLPPAKGCE